MKLKTKICWAACGALAALIGQAIVARFSVPKEVHVLELPLSEEQFAYLGQMLQGDASWDGDEIRCISCEGPMKAGDAFYLDESGGFIHAVCTSPYGWPEGHTPEMPDVWGEA